MLEARGIKSTPNRLWSNVEGDIDALDGVLRITKIRVNYYLKYKKTQHEKVIRAFKYHPEKCPAYMTLKDAVKFDLSFKKDQ